MSPRDLGITLIWAGAAVVLALLLYRLGRGAWSLEDDEVPPVSILQKVGGALALIAAIIGTVLFVRGFP
jgi:hypothetical protein